ncbi:MAG: ABC transporter permease [Armatimonadetes bacterium]|nr:ABC transporter permease [Armatimonadota bacterium]
MRRLWTVALKEARQHRWAFLSLAALLLGTLWLLLKVYQAQEESLTPLDALPPFLLLFFPLACLLSSHQLVVSEYAEQTQVFLETLPLRRWEMAAVKYLVGALVLFPVVVLSIAVGAGAAAGSEPIEDRFIGLMLVRGLVYAFFVWSFFFATAFTGRFRMVLYLGALFLLIALTAFTEFDPSEAGPIALVRPDAFAYERHEVPWEELSETLGAALALILLATFLQSFHEGSLAEELSRRMSQKEKAVILWLFLSFGIGVAYFDQQRTRAPFEFTDEHVLYSAAARLEVFYAYEESRKEAESLLRKLESSLVELRQELGWEQLPEARIGVRSSLDGRTFERAEMEENGGLLVRCDFTEPEFDSTAFEAYLVREILDEMSHGRARLEARRWAHDGFSRWWAQGGDGTEVPIRRALWATPEGISEHDLRTWDVFRERHGETVAEAVGYSGFCALERMRGRKAVLDLARELWGREPAPNDARRTFEEWRHPLAHQLEQSTGLDWDEFLGGWNRALAESRRQPAGLPRGTARVREEQGEGSGRDLVYSLKLERPLPAGTPWALVHARLGPFDEELSDADLMREEHLWPAGQPQVEGRLVGRYGRSDRIFVSIEVDSPDLGPIRLLAERRELR